MTSGVLFIENYIPGGSDQVARALIERLPFSRLTVMVNRGNDMRILLAEPLPLHVSLEYYDLVTTPELVNAARRARTHASRAVLRISEWLLRYPLFVFSIGYFRRRIAQSGAKIFIASNGGYPGGPYCRSATLAAASLPGVRAFHLVHSTAIPAGTAAAPIERIMDALLDRSCRVVAGCYAAADSLTNKRNFRQRPEVVYYGLPDRAVPAPTSSSVFRILHVGYFDSNKNQMMLIRALADMVARGRRDVALRFVGVNPPGGRMGECQRLAAQLGVEAKVTFVGFVDDVEPHYAECDVFVLCSMHEGLPITILEAMRAGKPVVATDVGGIREQLTHETTGLLVPPDDHVALALQLERLMADSAMRKRLGAAAREAFVRSFSAERMVERYGALLGLDASRCEAVA
jgi:glycosyltransferase involved in cell wall biosynthesis